MLTSDLRKKDKQNKKQTQKRISSYLVNVMLDVSFIQQTQRQY